jgi:hypothetical protein
VEYCRGEHAVRTRLKCFRKMVQATGTARSDHRNSDVAAHRLKERQIVSLAGTIAIHRGEKDLTGTE